MCGDDDQQMTIQVLDAFNMGFGFRVQPKLEQIQKQTQERSDGRGDATPRFFASSP